MFWINTAFDRLLTMAGVSLTVLAIGSLLAWCWGRPIERLRCIQATFVAVVAACLLQQLHWLPQVSLGWLSGSNTAATLESARASPSGDAHLPDAAVRFTLRPSPGHRADGAERVLAGAASARDTARLEPLTEANADSTFRPVERQTGDNLPAIIGWIRAATVTTFLIGAAWSLFYTGLGMLRLRTLRQNCAPAPATVVELMCETQASHARPVTVLMSSQIDVPLTFGIWRPVVVLPTSLACSAERLILRNCVAHEWSHVYNHDVAQWWALQALQPLLWFQPLYWILRRELRLCQDQLADRFAAGLASDPLSYAELLLRLAKKRRRLTLNMALTMSNGHSNMYRRIQVLASANHHLASVCRSWVTGSAVAALMVLTVALSAVNLGRAETPQPAASVAGADSDPAPAAAPGSAQKAEPAKQPAPANGSDNTPASGDKKSTEPKAMTADPPRNSPVKSGKGQNTDPSIMGEERPDGSLFYSGMIVDKTTKAPIRGATVTVRRMIVASFDHRILEETKHPTDELGKFSFVIPPKQLAEKYLYIELDVEHPDYSTKAGFGYALDMIRKNARLGDPPFYSHVELDPAAPLTGRLVGPDGEPLAGVPMLAYSNVNPQDFSNDNYGSFFHTKSGEDGSFRLNLTKEGPSVFWIVPEKFAPRQIVSGAKRGDWGEVRMERGVGLKGQVVDAVGKPISGVWVNVTDEKSQGEIQMPVGTSLQRSGQTDDQGRFELGPLKPGKFILQVEDYPSEIRYHSRERKHVDIPAVFPRRTITIGEGSPEPMLVRAIPHVQFEAQYIDSKGKKRTGWEQFVVGKLDGESYFGQLRPNAEGRFQCLLPHGLEEAKLELSSNEHGALRIRLGKDKPLIHGREIPLGTIEADLTGVEIVRYTSPIVQLKPVDEEGKPIPKVKVAGIYEAEDKEKLVSPVDGLSTSIFFEKQPGGIFRTSQMLPDAKTRFVASAEGYADVAETLSLPEGETRELNLVLKRSSPADKSKSEPAEKTEPAKKTDK